MGTPAQFLEQQSAQRQAERRRGGGESRKQLLSDEEFKENLNEAHTTITGLQQKLGGYDPASPEYASTKFALGQAIQARTALFHPDVHPGALHALAGEIGQKLHLIHPDLPAAVGAQQTNTSQAAPLQVGGQTLPAAPPAQVAGPPITPNELKAMAHANLLASALPAYKPPVLDADEQHDAARVQARLDAPAAAAKPVTFKDEGKAIPDGKGGYVQPQIGSDGQSRNVALPGYVPLPAKEPHLSSDDRKRLDYAAKFGKESYGELTNEQKAGYLAWTKTPAAKDSSRQALEFDADGNPYTATLHSHTGPAGGDAPTNGTGARRGASAAKTTTAASNTGGAAGLPRDFRRATPALTKAKEDYTKAVTLASFADQTQQAKSAELDRQLVERISKDAAGRFQVFEAAYLTKNLGLKNQIESMRNGVTTGKLPDDVRNQLVMVAHTNLRAQKDGYDAAFRKPGDTNPNVGGDDKIQVRLPDGTLGSIHATQFDNFVRKYPGATRVQ